MMRMPNEPLTPEDEQLLEAFRRHYAPPQRTAARRVAMRDALEARLHRAWAPSWLSIATAACGAALALWLVIPEPRASAPGTPVAASGEVFAAYALEGDTASEIDDLLPADYAAIESILDL